MTTLPPDTGTTYIHGLPGSVGGTATSYSQWDFFDSKEGIVSDITDEPDGWDGYNPVSHTKEVWRFPLVQTEQVGRETGPGGTCEARSTYLSAANTSLATFGHTSTPISWDSDENAAARAVAKLELNVQSAGFNLPVFLGELRDFKTLFNLVGRRPKLRGERKGPGLRKRLRNRLNRLRRESIADAIAGLASSDLFYNFAVKPLIADIGEMMKFGKHLATQRDRLSRLEPLTARGTVKDEGIAAPFSVDTTTHSHVLKRSWYRSITATKVYRLDTSGIPQVPAAMLAGDALGFDEPLKVGWELTPFSFLVDYFIQVGDWLDQFKGELVTLPHTVLQQGYSVKLIFLGEVETRFDTGIDRSNFGNQNSSGPITGILEKSWYNRNPADLDQLGPYLPTVRLPDLRQVRLIGDIVYLSLVDS